jgi:putative peptidoglycan lipid II flippase
VVLVLTQIFNVLLVPYFAHAGLALSIGLGALVNALGLLVGLLRRGTYTPQPGWGRFAVQVLLATGLLTALLGLAAHHLPWVAMRQEAWTRIGWMLGVLLCSGVLYFGVLWATGLRLQAFLKR